MMGNLISFILVNQLANRAQLMQQLSCSEEILMAYQNGRPAKRIHENKALALLDVNGMPKIADRYRAVRAQRGASYHVGAWVLYGMARLSRHIRQEIAG
jgi:hypothetical protein